MLDAWFRFPRFVGPAASPEFGHDFQQGTMRLVELEDFAQRAREIFQLYQTHRSLLKVVAELGARGWTNKSWKSKPGIEHVGRSFAIATLRSLLTNAIYVGR